LHDADAPLARRGTRRGPVLLAASALALSALGLAPPAAQATAVSTATTGRTALPVPSVDEPQGTPQPLAATKQVSLRVYLAGKHAASLSSAALAVSTPGNANYGHFLTPTEFQQRYGASAAQVQAVSDWLTSAGMKITAKTAHYIAVKASVAQADAAFDTQIVEYVLTITGTGGKGGTGTSFFPTAVGVTGSFSVPSAVGADIATVTGINEINPPNVSASASAGTSTGTGTGTSPAVKAAPAAVPSAAATASGYQCSHYWHQHVATIPVAYGRTTAPTQLCGYTPQQLRDAYGVTGSTDTGKGVTVAIVLPEAYPSMLSDANRFFASHGVAGFAPGQFTENLGPGFASSCAQQDQEGETDDLPGGALADPEEALDVETTHIAAPAANVVLVGADCVPMTENNPALQLQDLLDATTRIVDQHLADIVSDSWGYGHPSPADTTAWNLIYEQGALEGITFNYSSGDGGSQGPDDGLPTSAQFPATDPWVTAVGGTSLEIGKNGTAVADYPWGSDVTQTTTAGTGYTTPLPGSFMGGSGGGVSAAFAQPSYQRSVVPAALATDNGQVTARRVVPDISANAGSNYLIGYTGAVTPGVYAQVLEGGTSGSTPLISGLEADAIQAAGHSLGLANPALYRLYRTPAIASVPAVSTQHPPVVFGGSVFSDGDDNLTTLGEDLPPLKATAGYDDVTGLGAATASFVTALGHGG
jgi:subtilase family serine protease